MQPPSHVQQRQYPQREHAGSPPALQRLGRPDRLRILQWLTVLVPAVCAGLYETVRHTLLATALPDLLGTLLAVALVLVISSVFARVAFGMIRQTEARLRERNRQLQALAREVQRLAVIEERDRLAREMHDSVAQVLAYLLVRLDTIDGLLARGRIAEAFHEVALLRASADGAYADVREAIAGLRTRPGVGAAGLAAALRGYVADFGERVKIAAAFHPYAPSFNLDAHDLPPGAPASEPAAGASGAKGPVGVTQRGDDPRVVRDAGHDLSPAAELQLLRIAQEALANVRKHAGAEDVDVWFWGDATGWHLAIRDDGRGFDPHAPSMPGAQRFGLPIMRERVQSLGGSLAVISAPGAGTTVRAYVPSTAGRYPTAASSALNGDAAQDADTYEHGTAAPVVG